MVRLDDMRMVAALTEAASFTTASRTLGIPKQTLSRRIAAVEDSLGVRLVERTTRAFQMTDVGRAYAERCADIVRLADEANRDVLGTGREATGTLRVTADALFGERFLPRLLRRFLRENPRAGVDVVLTSRAVDLVEERFDVAFRIGQLADSTLVAQRIAGAHMAYVASPRYLEVRGTPRSVRDLAKHECIALAPEEGSPRWAFVENGAIRWVRVAGRLRVNSMSLALQAAHDGLGIANVPRFACAREIANGKLVTVLGEHIAPFGAIYLVHPSRRLQPARVRAFIEIARDELAQRSELADPRKRAR